MKVLFFPGSGRTLEKATAEARERLIDWYDHQPPNLRDHIQVSTAITQNDNDFVFMFTVVILG